MQLPRTEPDYNAVKKTVDDEFACKHTNKSVRKKYAADGAISIWHQCDRCGHKVGVAIKKATFTQAELDALPKWDNQIETGFHAESKKRFDELWANEKQRQLGVWQQAYEQYLQTPEWKRKRQLVLLRAQGICEGCREVEATDVHHLSYDDVGNEFLFELVALCRKCHQRLHGRIPGVVSSQPPQSI
jgi:hypothetical protein